MSIRVLIADDQSLVRAGFRMILEMQTDMEVVGEASDGTETMAAVKTLKPDVVLMDIQMPGMDGLEATRRIVEMREEFTKVLILTTFERDDYVFEALRAGASGFLLKNATPEDLVAGIRVVAEGQALLAPSVTRRVIAKFVQKSKPRDYADRLNKLTTREIDILKSIARGRTNAEIAEDLFIGEATVRTHVSNLLGKLNLRDRVQIVAFAYESGVVQPGSDGN
ncbi:MAG TPA: response regulator transcription factor [Candidatus Aminicenantes bacterium]|nr:response regulator transcription factor [Candidatus Aminicenantes bacterium]